MTAVGGRGLKRWTLAAAVLCVLAAAMAVVRAPAASASFGRDGKELLRLGGDGNAPKQAQAYPGGRILISLELFGPKEPAIVRLRPDGSLDRSFGNGGRAAIGAALTEVADIAVQPDGRILAAGTRGGGAAGITQAVVVRLLPNGRLDRSFARRGVKVVRLEGMFQVATAVAAMPGGSILLAGGDGYVGRETGPESSFIVRLRKDGRLDTGFAAEGRLRLAGGAVAGNLEPTASGNALVTTGFSGGPVLERLDAGGSFDPAFGQGGRMTVDQAGSASNQPLFTPLSDIAEAADGSILIGGSTAYFDSNQKSHLGMAVIRYSADGVRDLSYGVRGVARDAFDGNAFAEALAVQPSGRVLIAGSSGGKFAAACFSPNGWHDRRFGRSGKVTMRVAGSDRVKAVVLQAGGRVVLVGLSQNEKRKGPYNLTALARLRIGKKVR